MAEEIDSIAVVTTISDTIAEISGIKSEHIMQFFSYDHLPAHLQSVSKPFATLAGLIINEFPRNPERTVALRKLLESKDAAVRSVIAK